MPLLSFQSSDRMREADASGLGAPSGPPNPVPVGLVPVQANVWTELAARSRLIALTSAPDTPRFDSLHRPLVPVEKDRRVVDCWRAQARGGTAWWRRTGRSGAFHDGGCACHTRSMPMMFVVVLAFALAAQLPAPVASDEVRVATSALHTLVIAPDGRVLCQGRNQYGVCGVDQATAFVETLSPVPGIPRGRAVAVADSWTSMVLGEDGRVYVWGKNDFGLFGGTDRGPTYVRPQPTAVAALERVIGIAAFEYGGAALRDDGTVWMWGEDREGLLATGALTKSWQIGQAAVHAAARGGPRCGHADRGRLEAHARPQVGRHGVGLGREQVFATGPRRYRSARHSDEDSVARGRDPHSRGRVDVGGAAGRRLMGGVGGSAFGTATHPGCLRRRLE